MSLQAHTAQSSMERVMALSAETAVYLNAIGREVEKVRPSRVRTRDRNKMATAVAKWQRVVFPLVEYVFSNTERIINEIKFALRIQQFVPFPEDTWDLALGAIKVHHRNLQECERLRTQWREMRKVNKLLASAVWSPGLEERYLDLLDALDDLAETIALGVNEESATFLDELQRQAGLASP